MVSYDTNSEEFYRFLVDRCSKLVSGYTELKAELDELKQAQNSSARLALSSSIGGGGPVPRWRPFPGELRFQRPYERLLHSIGHALHVTRAFTGEIIYWNETAERLYGWKDYEVMGSRFSDLLVDEQYADCINKIMKNIYLGQSWSGQCPFKKSSGEIFFVLVTKSPLYEDDELVGVVTVSCDAAIFNHVYSNFTANQDCDCGQSKAPGTNSKRIPWHQRPQITFVPQIASSVSNLASRMLPRRHGDQTSSAPSTSVTPDDVQMGCSNEEKSHQRDDSAFGSTQPAKIADKFLSKLQIRGAGEKINEKKGPSCQNSFRTSASEKFHDMPCSFANINDRADSILNIDVKNSEFSAKGAHSNIHEHGIPHTLEQISPGVFNDCSDVSKEHGMKVSSPANGVPWYEEGIEPNFQKSKAVEILVIEQQAGTAQFSSFEESLSSSPGSSSSRGDRESNATANCEILWEDLQLGEEIGQGSYGVVYHGLWNGSDVAVEVLARNEYNARTLLDCKKEINIMRPLRHPNVLLFLGTCYSHDRFAIVTEYLPRGSLFKTLHRSNQTLLDAKRHLMMALDVARGMNYLHRRNPPVIHGDLKSSSLLVDKKWTVKVGDFGLSRLKHATLLSAKSGLGTPQWMAPEVLRSEPCNEKSDVFSFGVVLWELMTQSIPWSNLNSLQVVGTVGYMDKRLDIPKNVDPRIASIIRACWESQPQIRPSFQEIIQMLTEVIQNVLVASSSKIRRG